MLLVICPHKLLSILCFTYLYCILVCWEEKFAVFIYQSLPSIKSLCHLGQDILYQCLEFLIVCCYPESKQMMSIKSCLFPVTVRKMSFHLSHHSSHGKVDTCPLRLEYKYLSRCICFATDLTSHRGSGYPQSKPPSVYLNSLSNCSPVWDPCAYIFRLAYIPLRQNSLEANGNEDVQQVQKGYQELLLL